MLMNLTMMWMMMMLIVEFHDLIVCSLLCLHSHLQKESDRWNRSMSLTVRSEDKVYFQIKLNLRFNLSSPYKLQPECVQHAPRPAFDAFDPHRVCLGSLLHCLDASSDADRSFVDEMALENVH